MAHVLSQIERLKSEAYQQMQKSIQDKIELQQSIKHDIAQMRLAVQAQHRELSAVRRQLKRQYCAAYGYCKHDGVTRVIIAGAFTYGVVKPELITPQIAYMVITQEAEQDRMPEGCLAYTRHTYESENVHYYYVRMSPDRRYFICEQGDPGAIRVTGICVSSIPK